jgi:hypothetical protein
MLDRQQEERKGMVLSAMQEELDSTNNIWVVTHLLHYKTAKN